MKNFSINFAKVALIALFVVPLFYACKDDPDPPKLKTGTDLTTFNISAGGRQFSAELKEDGRTLEFLAPYLIDGQIFDQNVLKSATITFTLSEGATSSPASNSTVDLTVDLTITVTAEDEKVTKDYIVKKIDGTSSAKEITSFSLDIGENEPLECEIDNAAFVIYYPRQTVDMYKSLVNATPTFTLSLGATSNPQTGVARNFSPFEVDEDGELVLDEGGAPIPMPPVEYVVTAHDGTTQTWTVKESRRTGKDITGFALDIYVDEQPPHSYDGVPRGAIRFSSVHEDREGDVHIDFENGIITYDFLPVMPEWFDGSKMYLYPSFIDFSPGWQDCDPHFTDALDFSKDVTYVITAEDGSTKEWTIKAPLYYTTKQWEKEYSEYAGAIEDGGTEGPNSIGLIGEYLALGRTAALINKDDGTVAGAKLNITDIWRGNGRTEPSSTFLTNDYPFFITNDDAGNLLSASLSAWKNDVFTIYKWSNPLSNPEILMEFATRDEDDIVFSGFGRKIQVLGDVNGKGLIIASNNANVSNAGSTQPNNDAAEGYKDRAEHYLWKIEGGVVDTDNPTVIQTNIRWDEANYGYQLLTPLGLEPVPPFYIGTHFTRRRTNWNTSDAAIYADHAYPNLQFGPIGNTDKIQGPFGSPPLSANHVYEGFGSAHWFYQKLFTLDDKNFIAALSGSADPDYKYLFAVFERNADNSHVPVSSIAFDWSGSSNRNTNGTGGLTMEKIGNDIFFYVFTTNKSIACYKFSML